MRSPRLIEIEIYLLCGGGAFLAGPGSIKPASTSSRILTIILLALQDAKPIKTENKPGKIAVIFIDI